MSHWSENYIGEPYIKGEADCAALLCRVRREVFALPVPDGAQIARAASALGRQAQMADGVAAFGQPTAFPAEGDAVLMLCRGRPSHIGVYCEVDGERCVLHAMENLGMVVLHRLRELHRALLDVEGFYQWK